MRVPLNCMLSRYSSHTLTSSLFRMQFLFSLCTLTNGSVTHKHKFSYFASLVLHYWLSDFCLLQIYFLPKLKFHPDVSTEVQFKLNMIKPELIPSPQPSSLLLLSFIQSNNTSCLFKLLT